METSPQKSLSEVPGRDSDTELELAILGHEYTEPTRWEKPNVLILQRHEYYETLKPSGSSAKTDHEQSLTEEEAVEHGR